MHCKTERCQAFHTKSDHSALYFDSIPFLCLIKTHGRKLLTTWIIWTVGVYSMLLASGEKEGCVILNNPRLFLNTIKSLSENKNGIELPPYIVKDSCNIFDKTIMLGCFKELFIASGSLFDTLNHLQEKSCLF